MTNSIISDFNNTGRKPRSKRGNAKGCHLSHTHGSNTHKRGKNEASVIIPTPAGKNTKHRALSPTCDRTSKKPMAGQGRGSASNGSTEADSNELNKENDFDGNFGQTNVAIGVEIDSKHTTSIFSADKHSEPKNTGGCCEHTNKKDKRNGKDARGSRVKTGNEKFSKMKKTEMCRNMEKHGHCKYGDECSYAHDRSELVTKTHLPSNYKTKICT